MIFRIEINPDTSAELRTLSPHVVLQLGHALGELAEAASSQEGPFQLASGTVEIDGGQVLYEIDHAGQTIRVTSLELRTTPEPAFVDAIGAG